MIRPIIGGGLTAAKRPRERVRLAAASAMAVS
jgi:hypothetical protein